MMPNTAFALTMAGLAAGFTADRPRAGLFTAFVTLVLALAVFAVGTATLFEYASGVNLGVDQLLIPGAARLNTVVRPSPPTAVALTLLACALLMRRHETRRFVTLEEWLTLSAAFIAFVSLVGHCFGAGAIYEMRTGGTTGVALPTAIALRPPAAQYTTTFVPGGPISFIRCASSCTGMLRAGSGWP